MSEQDKTSTPIAPQTSVDAGSSVIPAKGLAPAAKSAAGRSVWMGTAIGIGSAAIVAALLYSGRNKS